MEKNNNIYNIIKFTMVRSDIKFPMKEIKYWQNSHQNKKFTQ